MRTSPQLSRLNVYLALVIGAGASVFAYGAATWNGGDFLVDHVGAYVAMALLLLASELKPVRFFRLEKVDEEPTAPSTTFVFAMLLVFGFSPTVVVHAVVSVIDDLTFRKPAYKAAFNAAQYALALFAANLVFEAVGWPLLDVDFGLGDVAVTLAAATAYFLANNILIAVAVAFFESERVLRTVLSVLRDQLGMEVMLLALGPLAAVVAVNSPVLLPLLLVPSLTVFISTRSVYEMERKGRIDALTELPNRVGFRALVDEQLTDSPVGAVVLLDLARFKYVNDTLGHLVGDHLLVEVAARLRRSCGDDVVLGRHGADEFIVFSSDLRDASEAAAFARRVIDDLAQPFLVDRLELAIEASAGVAVAPDHGRTSDELLRRADVSLHVAKSSPEQVFAYDPERDVNSRRHLRLLGELRAALGEGQLVLHYQPQVDLQSGEATGLEGLLRWQHPELGFIGPEEFLPHAEHSALIGPLTRWAIEQAMLELRRQLDAHRVLRMSVNVSGRALHDNTLPVDVSDMLRRYDVPAGLLVFEVTESALADIGSASRVLNTLAAMGLGVAIDDFGTGYSSLTYLRRLPVTEIKIDRSFVAGLGSDDHDAAIVRSTIELAHDLGLASVAEGVESEAVLARLRSFGCTRAQGYWLGRPMPPPDLDEWLEGVVTPRVRT